MTLTKEQREEIAKRKDAASASMNAAELPLADYANVRASLADIPALLTHIAEQDVRLASAEERAERAEALAERLKQEAVIHAQEARTANSTIAEIYRVVSEGKGEPGSWNGAEPVRQKFDALKAENEKLREALTRLVRVYEAEHDPDTISRPDWLDAALKEKPNDEG